MTIKQILYILIILALSSVLILVLPELSFCQPPPPSEPAQAPVDGGLALLAAAGGAYAVKRLRNKE